jgi:hypothetical protein
MNQTSARPIFALITLVESTRACESSLLHVSRRLPVWVPTWAATDALNQPKMIFGITTTTDQSIDELGEEEDVGKFFASVYPEVGAHFWLNGKTRLTASAQYHLTTAGRDDDFLFLGLSVGFLSGNRSSDEWKPLDEDDESQ